MEVIKKKTLLLCGHPLAFAGIALAQKYLPDPDVLNKIKAHSAEVTHRQDRVCGQARRLLY
jgi:hypothetical protein